MKKGLIILMICTLLAVVGGVALADGPPFPISDDNYSTSEPPFPIFGE